MLKHEHFLNIVMQVCFRKRLLMRKSLYIVEPEQIADIRHDQLRHVDDTNNILNKVSRITVKLATYLSILVVSKATAHTAP
jgi:hypothetical protein